MKYCEEYAALLSAFADGEATEQEREKLLAHLDSCDDCREYLAELMAVKEALADAVPELPENFSAQVMWRVRKEKTQKAKKNRRVLTMLGSLAACLVLVAAIPQLLNGGVSMESAAGTGGIVDGSTAGDDMEESVIADSAMPEAPEEGAVETPSVNDAGNDPIYDQAMGAEKSEYPTVTVEEALMDAWLDQGDFSALRAESAEGETEYYIDAMEYEEFARFMSEQGASVPELGESEFLVVYIR